MATEQEIIQLINDLAVEEQYATARAKLADLLPDQAEELIKRMDDGVQASGGYHVAQIIAELLIAAGPDVKPQLNAVSPHLKDPFAKVYAWWAEARLGDEGAVMGLSASLEHFVLKDTARGLLGDITLRDVYPIETLVPLFGRIYQLRKAVEKFVSDEQLLSYMEGIAARKDSLTEEQVQQQLIPVLYMGLHTTAANYQQWENKDKFLALLKSLPDGATNPLVDLLLKEQLKSEVEYGVNLIGDIGTKHAAEALLEMPKTRRVNIISAMPKNLLKCGENAIPVMEARLKKYPDIRQRQQAIPDDVKYSAEGLYKLGHIPRDMGCRLDMYTYGITNHNERAEALAEAFTADPAFVEYALENTTHSYAANIMIGLARSGDDRAVPHLIDAYKTAGKDDALRNRIAAALQPFDPNPRTVVDRLTGQRPWASHYSQ
jgi:hypothetical protein